MTTFAELLAELPKCPRSPGTHLTVVIRDDGPMIHCGDSPSYRSVTVALTGEQQAALALRWTGSHGYEAVSRCFIEEGKP